jgi:hypothetical protein
VPAVRPETEVLLTSPDLEQLRKKMLRNLLLSSITKKHFDPQNLSILKDLRVVPHKAIHR